MRSELTERQRYWCEHVRRAQACGESLAAYARARGISVGSLYNASSLLSRCGNGKMVPMRVDAAPFVCVQLEPSATAGAVCRLRHVSGWELQCERLPDAQWLRVLVQGNEHDAEA